MIKRSFHYLSLPFNDLSSDSPLDEFVWQKLGSFDAVLLLPLDLFLCELTFPPFLFLVLFFSKASLEAIEDAFEEESVEDIFEVRLKLPLDVEFVFLILTLLLLLLLLLLRLFILLSMFCFGIVFIKVAVEDIFFILI